MALAQASLAFACLGLLLTYLFQPGVAYPERSVGELAADCSGTATLRAAVNSTFFTKGGSLAAVLRSGNAEVTALLPEPSAFQGDRVVLEGRASEYAGKCWFFAEGVGHV